MEVWCLLVHVKDTRNYIVFAECITQPFQIGIRPLIQLAALFNLHHLFVGACKDNTDCLCLVLADLAMKPCIVNTVLDSLGTAAHSVGESYKFPIEVCSCFIGIIGNVHFAVSRLALYMARHPGVIAAATLQVAYGVLDITHKSFSAFNI